MSKETMSQSNLKKKLDHIKHPNIGITMYPPGKRLGDLERAAIFYPLSSSHFALFKLHINTGSLIFIEFTEFLFLSKFIFISSSMGLQFYSKSDGSLDANGTTCKLLFEKTGLKGFDFEIDEISKSQQLVIYLNDGNCFRSVAFTPTEKIPDDFISVLNQALEVNKWL